MHDDEQHRCGIDKQGHLGADSVNDKDNSENDEQYPASKLQRFRNQKQDGRNRFDAGQERHMQVVFAE